MQQHETVDLGEQQTNADGAADFDLQLDRFANATYSMQFFAEAFEGEGGRSITGQASVLVSALPYVVGYKGDGNLSYINANTPRAVDLLAVDPQLKRIAIENVTLDVIAQENVSVVVKKDNGSYGYESVLRERVAKSDKIAIGPDGLHYQLPTTEPGDYIVELRDDSGSGSSAEIRFSVVGSGIVKRSLDKNSELQVKLPRTQYNSGEEIEISITAPYAGSGLITIERDKVYALPLVQDGRRQQRAAHQGAGRFRRQRLHQRRVHSRARFEGSLHQSAQLRRGALHREHRKAPPEGRSADGREIRSRASRCTSATRPTGPRRSRSSRSTRESCR